MYERYAGHDQPRATLTIEQVDYHRNGVAGEGFHVVTFNDSEQGPMVAILFDGVGVDEKPTGRCAVLQRDQLSAGNVGFGSNSWRGDYWEEPLRRAIRETMATRYA